MPSKSGKAADSKTAPDIETAADAKTAPDSETAALAPQIIGLKVQLANDPAKNYEVMRFNPSLKVDLLQWEHSNVTMEREQTQESTREKVPRTGAGSEYNRRPYKTGMQSEESDKKQPWILEVDGKKFRGKCEGRISDTADYYAFKRGPDSVVKAHLLSDWHNFTPIDRYKTLSAEEVEEAYKQRNKILYYANAIIRSHLKGVPEKNANLELEEDQDEGETVEKKRKSDSDVLITSEIDSDVDEDIEKKEKENKLPVFPIREAVKRKKKTGKSGKNKEKKAKTCEIESTQKNVTTGILKNDECVVKRDAEKLPKKRGTDKNKGPVTDKVCSDMEEVICRYLLRKPMEYTRLLSKIKFKFPQVGYKSIAEITVSILQKLNPEQIVIRGKMFVYLTEKN